MKLVECVPNFSEGRNPQIIDRITEAMKSVEGITILDVDRGTDTNRTVVTLVGPPDSIGRAAYLGIARAAELIDMRYHKGAHPRLGATDVCPFIPVCGVEMEDCVRIAADLGRRVGQELGIPVYLYEYAATRPLCRNLSDIREGEYEGGFEKIQRPEWQPDFGPQEFNPRSGATVIGAREFLIAYNINLATRDKKIAHDIALEIREKGKPIRDQQGKIQKDDQGNTCYQPGLFKNIKAIGWFMESFGCAQLSINFTNYHITPIYRVFDEVCRLADQKGVRVSGSELVGLIPLQALTQAGLHYLQKQQRSTAVPDWQILDMAVRSLGLNDLYPFDIKKKVIELMTEDQSHHQLVNLSVQAFADELSSESPAPGGGSVAALCGALSAALGAMVSNLTYSKKGFETLTTEMIERGTALQHHKKAFVDDIDRDTLSFNRLMEAFRLPNKSETEKHLRTQAIEEATRQATLVPLEVMRRVVAMGDDLEYIALKGNPNSLSDAGVAVLTAQTALEGAYMNVLINLKGLPADDSKTQIRSEADHLKTAGLEKLQSIRQTIYHHLSV
ncbi:MAG: glutamate formimidoyltransferase [Candidatus Delongbacteria bacterium]|nr:glutamate formimidoyltransferase [Candidatus Delongbacteria bacterium]